MVRARSHVAVQSDLFRIKMERAGTERVPGTYVLEKGNGLITWTFSVGRRMSNVRNRAESNSTGAA